LERTRDDGVKPSRQNLPHDKAQCLSQQQVEVNVMKASIVIASLLVSVATVPAFAAGASVMSDEGLPPNVAQHWKRNETPMRQGSAERFVPQYLHAQGGEVTLTQNPDFMPPRVERTPAAAIRTQSIPATTYVGA
jgi:hypothetical protein